MSSSHLLVTGATGSTGYAAVQALQDCRFRQQLKQQQRI
jgi:NADPH:quinone reductase-like Zn-dependent oxidoreductase